MALNLNFPDLSNVESIDLSAENNNFVSCKAVVNYCAENNTSQPLHMTRIRATEKNHSGHAINSAAVSLEWGVYIRPSDVFLKICGLGGQVDPLEIYGRNEIRGHRRPRRQTQSGVIR